MDGATRAMARRLLLLATATLLAPADRPRAQDPLRSLELGVGASTRQARDCGTYFVSVDLAFAVAARDLGRCGERLHLDRAAGLQKLLGAAVAGCQAGEQLAAVEVLLVASELAGNELPAAVHARLRRQVLDEVAAVRDGRRVASAFLQAPEGELYDWSAAAPQGVFAGREELRAFWLASTYLRQLDRRCNRQIRSGARDVLLAATREPQREPLLRGHAQMQRLFGPAGPHLLVEPGGSMAPIVDAPDRFDPGRPWARDALDLIEALPLEQRWRFAAGWLGRLFDAEVSHVQRWPRSPVLVGGRAQGRANARSLLLSACREASRIRRLPELLAAEGKAGWAGRRLTASLGLYAALRSVDALDVPNGPVTGIEERVEIRYVVEPIPEVFQRLAQLYGVLEQLHVARQDDGCLGASQQLFELLANGAREALQGRPVGSEQAQAIESWLDSVRGRLPDGHMTLPFGGRMRGGRLASTQVELALASGRATASTLVWSLQVLQPGSAANVAQELERPYPGAENR